MFHRLTRGMDLVQALGRILDCWGGVHAGLVLCFAVSVVGEDPDGMCNKASVCPLASHVGLAACCRDACACACAAAELQGWGQRCEQLQNQQASVSAACSHTPIHHCVKSPAISCR